MMEFVLGAVRANFFRRAGEREHWREGGQSALTRGPELGD